MLKLLLINFLAIFYPILANFCCSLW